MSKNFKDWITIIFTAVILFVLAWKFLGFEIAKSLLNMSNYPALIISGAIALFLGLKRSKWSGLFAIVAIVLYLAGL